MQKNAEEHIRMQKNAEYIGRTQNEDGVQIMKPANTALTAGKCNKKELHYQKMRLLLKSTEIVFCDHQLLSLNIECFDSRIYSCLAKLFLDAEKLIVFGNSLTS